MLKSRQYEGKTKIDDRNQRTEEYRASAYCIHAAIIPQNDYI